ncbi:MAG: L,D-transpeptidase family protein [Bacteroidota bacterium]
MIITIALIPSCALKQNRLKMVMNSTQMTNRAHKQETRNDSSKFMRTFNRLSADLPYPQELLKLYKNNSFQNIFLNRFVSGGQLQVFTTYLASIDQHGLDIDLFPSERIKKLLNRKEEINSIAESDANELELLIASSLVRYSLILQFGVTIPSMVYENYEIPTLAPDSSLIMEIAQVVDLKKYLDSIQPKDKTYLALQKKLAMIETDKTVQTVEHQKKLIVNLERLRWKNRPIFQKFVAVNIANFTLNVMDKNRSVLNMKICVGEPGERATPQLGSIIHSVQVNPVWNIPHSIARQEIIRLAAEDRYYLANSKINVYQSGKLVPEPEGIDWSTVDADKYLFQQQPGTKNALGKIKFLFANKSSVYLHDTPERAIFKKEYRAVSHGCIRVEKPLELAYVLFGKSEKFQQIKSAMQNGMPRAKYIVLTAPVPVRILYYTAWIDGAGDVKFCDDIYGWDDALYIALQKPVFNDHL